MLLNFVFLTDNQTAATKTVLYTCSEEKKYFVPQLNLQDFDIFPNKIKKKERKKHKIHIHILTNLFQLI